MSKEKAEKSERNRDPLLKAVSALRDAKDVVEKAKSLGISVPDDIVGQAKARLIAMINERF